MEKARQADGRPTNKLTVGVVALGVMGFIEPVWAEYLPMFDDHRVYTLIQALVALAAGYFVKDRPNVPEAKQNG